MVPGPVGDGVCVQEGEQVGAGLHDLLIGRQEPSWNWTAPARAG
jgi:hypothetical protein